MAKLDSSTNSSTCTESCGLQRSDAPIYTKSETVSPGEDDEATDQHMLSAVVERWRGRTIRQRTNLERAADEARPAKASPEQQAAAQPQAIDPNRFKLLKRPLDQQIVSTGWNRVAEPHQR
jgi:hypothetical protein